MTDKPPFPDPRERPDYVEAGFSWTELIKTAAVLALIWMVWEMF